MSEICGDYDNTQNSLTFILHVTLLSRLKMLEIVSGLLLFFCFMIVPSMWSWYSWNHSQNRNSGTGVHMHRCVITGRWGLWKWTILCFGIDVRYKRLARVISELLGECGILGISLMNTWKLMTAWTWLHTHIVKCVHRWAHKSTPN